MINLKAILSALKKNKKLMALIVFILASPIDDILYYYVIMKIIQYVS